jgi:hypothetical protein
VQGDATIIDSFRQSFRDLRADKDATAPQTRRTERDMPFKLVIFGSLGLALFMASWPQLQAVPGVFVALCPP